MGAVEEQDGVRQLRELFEYLLFRAPAAPQEPEIAADDQGVASFERTHFRRGEPGKIGVHIAGDINHDVDQPFPAEMFVTTRGKYGILR